MIRTGDEYRESIRDGREVWMNGEKIADVTTHPAFKPAVDARALIYDLQHRPECQETMTYVDEGTGEQFLVHWFRAVEHEGQDLRPIVSRGDFDGRGLVPAIFLDGQRSAGLDQHPCGLDMPFDGRVHQGSAAANGRVFSLVGLITEVDFHAGRDGTTESLQIANLGGLNQVHRIEGISR